ncbi:MAG TPA: hypothetical protein VFT50_07125 [Baekduia sp.]|nr:hypothetical protein [Baekduia sp.]
MALALPAGAAARPGMHTIFQAPRELRGEDSALRSRTLDEIHDLGADWLRVVLYWRDVAPAADSRTRPSFPERDPNAYNWAVYDRMMREAHDKGLHLLVSISGPVPRWATRSKRDQVTRPSAKRYGRFTEAVARHFGGLVDAYSIWNEPNHPDFLKPQWTGRHHHRPTSAKLYRRLFIRGARGLAAGGAGSTPVLMGETASRGTSQVVGPTTFLRVASCLNKHWHKKHRSCHRLPADGYAHHAYTSRGGPYYKPPKHGDITIRVLHRLNHVLAKAGRAGAIRRGMRIWLTEFGIQSWPDRVFGVKQRTQAEWRAIGEHMAYANKRVVMFSQYLMRDDDPVAGAATRMQRYSGFQTGLRGARGGRKKSYAAFRLPLVALKHGHRVKLWGMVRPARRRTTVTIEFKARGSRRWHVLKRKRTNAYGAWRSSTSRIKGRRYRVRWKAPSGHWYRGPATRVHHRT